ncbi:PolA DNA polymerase I - 3'-5' exonuclease and polymerase domains [uncultured Caudovirales phage]|uniref:PolA DNA polymerase I - 3'-5' exonuclease and polymerase domains n=1 Tax=uncultured Caudovirales phage TaxID=2100421 RepID=A0A6J5TC99_9CAUD|nr:PolA DNA polymerase I - 3'-5' exonuclease and polymerase domains [uncultured Caudovirales phage]CAB5218961.1 PolA DNA polymerase I - 3'-5' exonuclease and polymerase domains [uncultured Caudovirales phage]
MSQPYKTILCVDAETRWSSKPTDWSADPFTLSKMTTEEYIRSPHFKAFGFCIHEVGSSQPVQWYSHRELKRIFSQYDWTKTAVLAHNAQFDVGIMSMIYDINPCFIFDTLSMGRALRGVEVGNSLMKLAEDYGLPPKGKAVHSTDGLYELDKHIERELADYCKHDVFLCEEIFANFMLRIDPVTRLSAGPYPTKELRLIDMTVRMYTHPTLVLDKPMLEKALEEDNGKLAAALERVGAEPSQLASNDQFAEILQKLSVEVPKKPSPANKDKMIFAFAKNDALFQQMLNGDNEDVALLCEARLKVKSNMERNRAQRFIDISERGNLPVPLSYYGAATGRWTASKGSNINMQNLKRGSALRNAIMAPDDHVIVVGDLSQIEPRVLAWLAGYETMLAIFRAGGDPYATFGSTMFSIAGMTKESHPLLRQSAKSALLGAGYQLGWASFAAQLLVGFLGAPPQRYTKADAKQLGVTAQDVLKFTTNKDYMEKMAEIAHTCTDDELLIHCLAAKAIIDKYRAAAEPVVDFWHFLGERLEHSLVGGEEYNYKGVLIFRKDEIEMVNGMTIRYPDLKMHVDEKDPKKRAVYTYQDGKKRIKLYPGKICNNVTQGTARIIMTDGMLRTQKRYRPVLTVHDEQGVIAPLEEAKEAKKFLYDCMVQVPKWMPGIPLNADVGFHQRYGRAKS